MLGIHNPLDPYSRQARLFPGLLTIFPPLLAVLAWFPYLIISSVGATLLTLGVSCGLLYLLASYARMKGKKVEPRLLAEWRGLPTTHLLRHRGELNPQTRARYHKFLSAFVPRIQLPTEQEERANPEAADETYASAVEWLKEQTRGRQFPLVEKENAHYGYRRNLRGLKPLGITLCLGTVLVSVFALLIQYINAAPDTTLLAVLGSERIGIWAAIVVNLIAIGLWYRVVNDAWVRDGADQYARALLATCDKLSVA